MNQPKKSRTAPTKVTSFDDGTFIRTALVVGPEGGAGSIDLVDGQGQRVAQLNVSLCEDGRLIVDTIDVDARFGSSRAFIFGKDDDGSARRLDVSMGKPRTLVSADFQPKEKD